MSSASNTSYTSYAVVCACLCLLLAAATPAPAQVAHGNFGSLNVDFLDVTETTLSAGPPVLYGAPTSSAADRLSFVLSSFLAACTSDGSDTEASELSLQVEAHPGTTLRTIALSERGSATLSASPPPGTATTNAAAALSGTVTVVETTDGPIAPVVIPFSGTFDPASSFALPGDAGQTFWRATATIDVASIVPNATLVAVALNDTLSANCGAGDTGASTQKTSASVAVTVFGGIPVPATIPAPLLDAWGLLAASAAGLWFSRRGLGRRATS